MSEFVIEYWRQIAFGVIAVILVAGNKIKTWVGSVKLPALSAVWPVKSKDVVIAQDKQAVEAEDISCISHLRDRAVEVNDEVLLQEIKSVANKFFDIHSKLKE